VAREEALWEKGADPTGAPAALAYTATVTANYALAVFVDDVTAAGGQYTVRYEEYTVPADQPDLVVTGMEPLTAGAGSPVTAVIHVANQGGAASSACVTRVTLDYAVTCAGVPTPAIAAGGSVQVTCSLPAMVAGDHDLYAFVDYGDAVAEGDETNNARLQTLAVSSSPSLPDLDILDMGPGRGGGQSDDRDLVKVANIGGAPADTSTVRYDLDFGDLYVYLPTPQLNAGQTVTVKGLLPGIAEGEHHAEAVANTFGSFTEVTWANNGMGITVTATGPNLIVESVTRNSSWTPIL